MQIEKVKAVQDNDSHWYILPNYLLEEFESDLLNEELQESGEFGEKYEQYKTNGDLNNIQLYAEILGK